MNTRCVVVVGHVDHGKTTLVRALTGIDTDRLPEEKARGLSIAPGFAHCKYPGGVIDLIDAPGHADFIQAMVSGAAGAQAALVVVSMTEGISAQTIEHLTIVDLLGVSSAIIAVTKSDLVPAAEHAARVEEIRSYLAHTPFSQAPVITLSARSGPGLAYLHQALENLLSVEVPQQGHLPSFLPIDRRFSLDGHGTVVTGTLLGSDLTTDTEVVLQPTGQRVTIRGLQSRGEARASIHAGERMAANLRGVAPADIPRGAVLCAGGAGTPSRCVDVHLTLLPEDQGTLKHRQDVRVSFGASSAVAQVRLFKSDGRFTSFAQLRFPGAVVGYPGQIGILRSLSPPRTIGRTVFLDPLATPRKLSDAARLKVLSAALDGNATEIAEALIAEGHGVAQWSDILRLARLSADTALKAFGLVELADGFVTTRKDLEAATSAMRHALAAYHDAHPLQAMAPRATIRLKGFAPKLVRRAEDDLTTAGQIRRQDNMLALSEHDPMARLSNDQRARMAAVENQYLQAGLDAPSASALLDDGESEAFRQLLLYSGRLIDMQNVALGQTLTFHAETIEKAATALAAAFPDKQPFTTSQARIALSTSRRIIVPLLEHFDTTGVTLRTQNTRQITTPNSISPGSPA